MILTFNKLPLLSQRINNPIMKKVISASLIIVMVVALASCGSSRKYGCPSVAQSATKSFIKA
jgi:hypothetical protein